MAEFTIKTKILTRNDTKENWKSVNPVLGKGEIGIESDTRLFKFGDGVTAWNELKYADTEHAVLKEADPTTSDYKYSIGTKWVNTTSNKVFLLFNNTANSAIWKQVALMENLEDLGAGDMLKAVFATQKPEEGYVDKSVLADTATKANAADKLSTAQTISLEGDATGSTTFDGSKGVVIAVTLKNSGVSAGTYTKITVDQKGIVTAAENITVADLPNNIPTSKIQGLGTAASANTGSAEGNVPVIGSGNKLNVNIIPDITLSKVTDAGTAAGKNVGTGNGEIPILGSDGKLDNSVLPAIAITDTFEVASESEMTELTAQKGDVAVRSDINKTFILKQEPASTASNWVELKTPTDAVLSVNGETGAVTLDTDKIQEGSTNQYFTEARATANFKTHSSTELTDGASILRNGDVLIINGGDASTTYES